MPVPMPSFADALLSARFSDDPIILLVTIVHPSGEIIRLARNTEDVTSRGEVFKASWFEVDMVNDDGAIPVSTLAVPNADNREIGQRYFRQSSHPEVTIEAIALSMPDDVITDVRRLEFTGITLEAIAVTGRLTGKDHSAEPYGTITVLPSNFPALFRRQRKT
jgi:hypothetical protein